MKIILETLMAGPIGVFQPGEHDLPEKLAKELIKTGHAQPVDEKKAPARPVIETASLKPGEQATA